MNTATAAFTHFGHGCVLIWCLRPPQANPASANTVICQRAAAGGGLHSLSGEHGDGNPRRALLPKMFGPELVRAFAIQIAWDPDYNKNPN
jgi:hypothetical protein